MRLRRDETIDDEGGLRTNGFAGWRRRCRQGVLRPCLLTFLLLQLSLCPLLASGPAAAKPTFTYVGTEYYRHGAVYPIGGHPKDTFYFAIKYQDNNWTPPKKGYPRLLIDLDHDGAFNGGKDVNLTMEVMATHPPASAPDYYNGVDYVRDWVFNDPGTYSFAFVVVNEENRTAFIGPFDGPVVYIPEHVYSDPMTDLALFGLLIIVFCIVFFVLGMAAGQGNERKARRRRMEELRKGHR
jgi:hypothetical protein